jgi:lia operon protein LiaH
MLKRIVNLISAAIHEGLDQIEDPKMMLNHTLRQMEAELAEARRAILKQQALAASFEKSKEEAEALEDKRRRQAQQAFNAGEENLARRALAEMKLAEARAKHYAEQAEIAAGQVRELKEQAAVLERRYQELKDRKHALIARANFAEVKERIAHSLHSIDTESLYREFQRLENRILEQEIRANAYMSISDEASYARFEYADEIEQELERMRREKKENVS